MVVIYDVLDFVSSYLPFLCVVFIDKGNFSTLFASLGLSSYLGSKFLHKFMHNIEIKLT
jgi:hypothetical protein